MYMFMLLDLETVNEHIKWNLCWLGLLANNLYVLNDQALWYLMVVIYKTAMSAALSHSCYLLEKLNQEHKLPILVDAWLNDV